MKTRIAAVAVCSLVCAACSSDGNVIGVPDLAVDSVPTEDGAADVGQDSHGVPDLPVGPDGVVAPEETFDFAGPQCRPGEGCFLDPCSENKECQSGWCVEHMGDGVCTQLCTEECPPGWKCQRIGGAAPDLVYAGVSVHANL